VSSLPPQPISSHWPQPKAHQLSKSDINNLRAEEAQFDSRKQQSKSPHLCWSKSPAHSQSSTTTITLRFPFTTAGELSNFQPLQGGKICALLQLRPEYLNLFFPPRIDRIKTNLSDSPQCRLLLRRLQCQASANYRTTMSPLLRRSRLRKIISHSRSK
jgi:hypothetical protein